MSDESRRDGLASRTNSTPGDALSELEKIAGEVESRIPARYRRDAFRVLAQRAVLPPDEPRGAPPAPDRSASRPADQRQDLGLDGALLNAPGRPLLKALLALQAAADGLGQEWLTPSELEGVLTDRGSAAGVYRSNLSNALRGAAGLVERRQRGRGYEYRITPAGRRTLAEELRRVHLQAR